MDGDVPLNCGSRHGERACSDSLPALYNRNSIVRIVVRIVVDSHLSSVISITCNRSRLLGSDH